MNNLVQLSVDAGNPTVHIEIIDGHLNLAAHGYGCIEVALPPGAYTLRYLAGDAKKEKGVLLKPGLPVRVDEFPHLNFGSAAPLEFTWSSNEYHQYHASLLSRKPPLRFGFGSELLLLVRDLYPGNDAKLVKGLTLRRLDGSTVLDFEPKVETRLVENEAPSAGCRLALDPGSYMLRLDRPDAGPLEMIVHASAGRQCRVFLLRRMLGECFEPDLENAAQMNSDLGSKFVPYRAIGRRIERCKAGEDLGVIELARQALAHGRRGLSKRDLVDLLNGKWQDPLLGIIGLHLLLRHDEPDLELAWKVLKDLRRIFGEFAHPDVESLAMEVAFRRRDPEEFSPVIAPPLFRASWQMLVRASGRNPRLVPADSLCGVIGSRLWGSGAWLIWRASQPSEPMERTKPDRALGRQVLQSLELPTDLFSARDEIQIPELARNLTVNLRSVQRLLPSINKLVEQVGLDAMSAALEAEEVESIVLSYVVSATRRRSRLGREDNNHDPLEISTMVDRLGLPATQIASAITTLVPKVLELPSRYSVAVRTTSPEVSIAEQKIGNPAVVGLAGFGLTTMVLQFHNVGWMGIGPVIWLGLIFGGLAQMIAGLQEMKTGNNFGYCAFTAYGCFWIALALLLIGNHYNIFVSNKTDIGWFLIAWTGFTAILWIGSMRLNGALALIFTLLLIGFILLDLAHFGYPDLTVVAGYVLMACAAMAWYIMAHLIFADVFGRDVLPVGKPWLDIRRVEPEQIVRSGVQEAEAGA